MTNVIMIHGSYGDPNENWFPWLKGELEKLGCKVFIPRFPTPEGQTLDNWLGVFRDYESYMGEDTIVIGHSIGPAFLLTVLETRKARAAFFVAGFVGLFSGKWADPRFDTINKTISEKPFDWQSIRANCRRFYMFYSDNDPYVPPEKTDELARSLGTAPILVRGAGHFNAKYGYTKFELLLDRIKEELG